MNIQLIQWMEIEQEALNLLTTAVYERIPLSPGLEAEVVQLNFTPMSNHNQSFVLKIWNKHSLPDVGRQYELLANLFQQGISVSKPYGWGVNEDRHSVLLMSYDGKPMTKLDKSMIKKLAQMLVDVHRVKILDARLTPSYDFVDYFYPGIEKHGDIYEQLMGILNSVELSQQHFIHGDYNLGNVLEEQGQLTIIDWTNGQLGDPRYDIAWSVFLMKLYAGTRYGGMYFSEFVKLTDYSSEELEAFEAMACLRWILLSRLTDIPRDPNTLKRIRKLIQDNGLIHEQLL
ncbi:aminoglycoside phosphotransferase family protein [Paenibacillus camelliae]|uniref:aminoglycoside phosphotransferase family protein n=1 Tax=Paenibacillus camelliae TaxID=512410 RepID=UPI00203F33BC|nr:aminoglycoside phosphotransferase family protein [Paenibacillus camelliae]MCM3633635.1 aminoglycoside phosphotransferase family protein [Paenibacillus camelliae]